MGKLLLVRERVVHQLLREIKDNLDRYRSGSFDYLLSDESNFIATSIEVNDGEISKVACSSDNQNEVQCCLGLYKSLPGLDPYLARDERLWVYLTHTLLLDYSRTRWPIPKDDARAISHIQKHFFASGSRGVERDNAASRLWWMASICSKVEGMSLEKALTAFLFQSDVRANIIERPTTSQNVVLLSSVVKKLDESLQGDKALYERETFRSVMKDLNLQGGIKLLEALDPKEVERIVVKCAAKV